MLSEEEIPQPPLRRAARALPAAPFHPSESRFQMMPADPPSPVDRFAEYGQQSWSLLQPRSLPARHPSTAPGEWRIWSGPGGQASDPKASKTGSKDGEMQNPSA